MLLLVVLTELCGDVGDVGDASVRLLEYVLLVTVLISEGRWAADVSNKHLTCTYTITTYTKHAQFSVSPLLRSGKPCCCGGHG